MSKNEKFHQDSDFELNDDALNSVAGGAAPDVNDLVPCTRCGAFFKAEATYQSAFCPQCMAFIRRPVNLS